MPVARTTRAAPLARGLRAPPPNIHAASVISARISIPITTVLALTAWKLSKEAVRSEIRGKVSERLATCTKRMAQRAAHAPELAKHTMKEPSRSQCVAQNAAIKKMASVSAPKWMDPQMRNRGPAPVSHHESNCVARTGNQKRTTIMTLLVRKRARRVSGRVFQKTFAPVKGVV